MNGFNFSDAKGIYLGNTLAKEVYYGSTKIWGGEHDYSKDYLTIEFLESGKLQIQSDGTLTKTIYYSEDDGTTWNSVTSVADTTIDVGNNHIQGDKILLKGSNSAYGTSISNCTTFVPTGKVNLSGNIMSLIHGDNFVDKVVLTEMWTFVGLFADALIVSAKNLVLPATTLTNGCYRDMFSACEYLVDAPELPATTIETRCYYSMFDGCINLEKAPELPAKNIALTYCYRYLFRDCAKINYIKCLGETHISNATNQWVNGVAATGTFVKSANATFWTTGANGIPSGWRDESE
jgi:hypothetical protein